jgi:polysaccharide export outer membrane protein
MRANNLRRLAPIPLLASLALAGCGASLPHVWVDQISQAEIGDTAGTDYVIARGDLLTIRVYGQDPISTHGRVRPDGKIAVPLAGELEAEGRRPADLAREIEARLKPFVVAPAVVIGVDEVQPIRISVLGEVARPGAFALEPRAGVLQALAIAGGTTEYADRERIFVIRRTPGKPPLRIRFSYADLAGGRGRAATFALATGDVVTVE